MTIIELDEHRPTAMRHLIEVALKLEKDEDVDHWELADSVLAAVGEHGQSTPSTASARMNTGLYKILDDIRWELREAGAIHVGTPRTLRNAYRTAVAWPAEDRVEGANYWAHYELSGSTWANRKRILERLVEERRNAGQPGLVGTPQVRLRKSDENKADLRPRDEKLEAAIRAAVTRWASPQTFYQLHEDEQTIAIKTLEKIANELRAGTFQ